MKPRTHLCAPLGRLLAAALLAAGVTGGAAAQTTTLRMSSWVPPIHYIQKDVFEPWMADVEKATAGRVAIHILPSPLGSPAQHFELARLGVADVTWGNFTYEPDRFKSIWFAEFPFSGSRAEASSLALWDTYQKYLAKNKAYRGVVMLAVGTLGGGAIHHGSRPVVELADLKNQKVRMGGPIQKRLLEELGAIPIAAPAPKAYELLESGVVDASLHPLESIVNFRLEDKLKQHTLIPDGFYEATFFVVVNEAKWNKLAPADRAAIMKVSGENLTRRWGARFDLENRTAEAKLRAAGHVFSKPSPALLAKIGAVRAAMLKDWAADAAGSGVPNAAEMVSFYEKQYKAYAAR